MDMQLLVAIIIGVMTFLYIGNHFKKQLTHIEKDSKCEDCPVPNEKLINKNNK